MPTPSADLASALKSIEWTKNVNDFLSNSITVDRVAKANFRLAVWARQFESIEKGNPALCFVREMQAAGHHAAALVALALYKPAAAAIRTVFETALYYTYFRTHSVELATLVRDSDYYVSKSDVFDYHKVHSPRFTEYQTKLGLVGRANEWYGFVSSIIHGQVPGTWIEHKSLAGIKHENATLQLVVDTFCKGEELVHHLFLCTAGKERWNVITTPAKKILVSGLHADVRAQLDLDTA